jgi:hypothetical protein
MFGKRALTGTSHDRPIGAHGIGDANRLADEGGRDASFHLRCWCCRMAERYRQEARQLGAIFAVPAAIAGIYDMNFKNMPELELPAALLRMLTSCVILYCLFRTTDWL